MRYNEVFETDEAGNCAFAFMFILENPGENFRKLVDYYCEKHITIDWLQLEQQGDLARIIIYCRFERGRRQSVLQALKNRPGAISVEWMGAKALKNG